MKRLAVYGFILLTAFTAPVSAQNDLPTPEAFAIGCMDDLVLSIQQVTDYFENLDRILEGREPRLSIELVEEVVEELLAEFARTEIKAKSCDKIAAMLGENYTIHLNKIMETPEVRLALFEYMIVIEELKLKMASHDGPEGMFEDRLAEENHQTLNKSLEAYVQAIRQKVERNWIKPAGSGEMPVCEVHVVQGPGGIVLDVAFGACPGSTTAYRNSIENAVLKADPLPEPGDPALFESELKFLFSPVESSETTIPKSSNKTRSAVEIERVFQKNRGGIFNLYNRALRKNPLLGGKVVFELTVSPGGQVTASKVLSSELSDAKLERQLILKIKKFKFANEDVGEITVTYPITFLPG